MLHLKFLKHFILCCMKELKMLILDHDYAGSPNISTCFEKRTCFY